METEFQGIMPHERVTVTKMNHLVEVQYMKKMNRKCSIKKLDADRYVNLITGEVCEYEKAINRSQSENSLRKTFKRLRYLINNNYTGASNELFVTFTYKENMTDPKRLYDDFKKFMKRFRYEYRDTTQIEFINVVEPQGRGAWHCHVLFKFVDLDNIYIDNAALAKMWGNGFVTIQKLKDVDNIGAYVSAYLTDLPLDSDVSFSDALQIGERDVVEKEINGVNKKILKGGRLALYPPGMNLYRQSRGIKKPDRENVVYKDIKKVVGRVKPNYSKTYEIVDDSSGFCNTVHFEAYNLNRD